MDVFDLMATIRLDSTQYEQGLSDAENKASSFGSKLSSGLGTAAKVGTAAVGAVAAGVTAASAAFVGATNELSMYGDAIDKNSQKLGISAEAYQEWDAILQHSGSSASALKPAMKTLQKEAQSGSEAFQRLGLSQEQVASMSKEDLFAATISGLQGITDENERAALATELLGKGAIEMGALLNTSAEDTEAMRQKVHELGGVMSDEAVKAAAKYRDTLQDMRTAMDGLKRNLVSQFLPSVTSVMEGITDIFTGDSDGGLAKVSKGIDDLVTNITDKLPKVLEVGGKIIESIIMAITQNLPSIIEAGTNVVLMLVQGFIENLPTILKAGIDAILTLQRGIAQALPQLIPAAVDAILEFVNALLDNLPDIIEAGMELTIGIATGLIEAIPKIIERLPEIITAIVEALIKSAPKIAEAGVKLLSSLVQSLPKIISNIVAAIPKIISGIVGAIGEGVGAMVEAGKNLIGGLWDGIKSRFTSVIDGVKNFGGSVIDGIKGVFGIASPSKVFEGIGEFLMQGMALGIEDGMGNVEGAMDDLEDILAIPDDVFTDTSADVSVMPIDSGESSGGINYPTRTETLLQEILEALNNSGVYLDGDSLVGGVSSRMDMAIGTARYYGGREAFA